MTWGKELWDQFDLIANHTNAGIDYVEKVSKFVKERCEIETRYAKDLRRLVRSYLPKKKDEDEKVFSFQKAFTGVVKETDDFAGQHELIAESLMDKVYKELHLLHNELKTERRKHLNEGKKVQEALEQSMKSLDASKKAFMKASEEADTALQAFQKADQDMANSRLVIEKFKTVSVEKGQALERARDEYRNQLEQTNSKQALHYSNEMPAVFDDLQKMDERRIQRTGELLKDYSNLETKVMPIIQKCLDNIKDYGNSVKGPEDSKILSEQNKTAIEPPKDIQFEEYGKAQTLNRQPQSGIKESKKKKGFGNLLRKGKKHGEADLDGRDQALSPGQKLRTCKKKVQQLDSQIAQLKNSREGMEKMVDVYRQNPSLGDPNTIEQQLSENARELDALNEDLHKYQCYLAALENKTAPPAPEKYSAVNRAQPQAAPTEDHFDGTPPPPAPAPPPAMLVPPVEEPDDDPGEWGEDDEVQCKVIYDFQASNDGELTVSEGEVLFVLEQDHDNSGWTKVLKDEDEGYVPSSYIELL
ncbi:formin-binding protein 1-like [Montipora capricornis]|uniref:formin-binding protein 1-like n=1 Tax=Montipora capricornis TaxID=246305 RepID=UPI0035F202BA